MAGRRFTKGIDLLEAMDAYWQDRWKDAVQANADMAAMGMEDAHELTSGTISTKTLRRLGHPFARRTMLAPSSLAAGRMRGASAAKRRQNGIRGHVPLLPINRQTGKLQRSFVVRPGRSGGYRVTHDLASIGTRYAKYILSPSGTTKMIGRGVQKELEKRWKVRVKSLNDYLARTS